MGAYAELVVAGGSTLVTMASVAERAGVAERTVYRHFPNGRALLDGLSEQVTGALRGHGVPDIRGTTLDAALEHAEALYRGFEAAGAPMKAAVIAAISAGYRSPGQGGRVDQIRHALRAELPDLSESDLGEALTMVRFQLGATAWYLLTEREGLSTDQAARLSARAVRAFVDSLAQGASPAAPKSRDRDVPARTPREV